MKVVFIEVIRGFWKNSYKELGQKEMSIVPIKGDVIQRDGSNWKYFYEDLCLTPKKGIILKFILNHINYKELL